MQITEKTIINYVKGIINPNTSKTCRLSPNKFRNYLKTNEGTEINQENINQITQNYKAATINHHLIILKTFINDYTSIQYDKKLKLVKTEKRKPKYLTIEQIQTVLKYADDKTDELIIKLLTTTGLRIKEALKITKKELKNTDENGNALITIIGKNNKRRTIFINS